MPPPSLRIPMLLNMDGFQKNIESAKGLTSTATKYITKQFIDMNAQVLATQGATGAAVLGFRSILGVLGPLGLAITGIVGVFRLMGYATELAKEKIEEFNEIAEKAAKANVSTDFFQRFTKSGEQLRLTVDQVNDALERFNNSSRAALGGSALEQRLAELQKAGNFEGNAGAGALTNATDTEAKLRATVQLIREAFEAGQRLAGLDIAKNAFGPEITDRLRQDATFLDQMLSTAQKLSADKIVSDDQVSQAIQLKTRLEDAQKVLAEKFKPIQDDLAKLGVNYHESWIGIVETMSSAVTQANSLYGAIKRIPDALADAGSSSFWTKLTEVTGKLGLNSDPKSLGIIFPGEPGFADDPARGKLAAGLNNPNAVRRSMQDAIDVQTKLRGDNSIAPAQKETADAYDRAIESLQKHTSRLQADTQAVGLGAGALEEFRAKSALLTAAQQAGIPVQGETAKKIDEISRAAGAAGEALAKARVASEIKFGAGTAFLSDQDVAIAQQLRSIYGNDIPAAMSSSQAAALRLVDANREISSTISGGLTRSLADAVDGTQTAEQAFASFAKSTLRAIEEVIIKLLVVGPLMRTLQGGLGGLGGLFGIGSNATDGIGGFGPTAPIGTNAAGTDNWRGGPTWVGEEGPEIVNLPRGAQVIPNDIARQAGGSVSAPVSISIDARGADNAAETGINQQLAQLKAELPSIVVESVKRAQKGRNL
ncbi:hypothetical protein J4G43_025795 [Bradyrhizobium barranii subsp. barranii]|uniref:Bacteriophage tail tape measure N-terminal domain-containing protein n=1 Tax=Bradyrhizobium barranii subsp. barranii TaxID=2823807 RepID=A0A939S034_9BRAD|nr:hypothetical protein [Bradyrhizobium barranii]UEM17347.1 hypothetical protein J4G43_025795 [Bradyrhizobium barranii subsp. barranii]